MAKIASVATPSQDLGSISSLTPVAAPRTQDFKKAELLVPDGATRQLLLENAPDIARVVRTALAIGISRLEPGSSLIRRHEAADAAGELRADRALAA